MAEVTIILTLSKGRSPEANVLKRPPGPNNMLGPHVAITAELRQDIWNLLIAGDELDPLVQAAFEMGRACERGEYDTIIH